MATLKFAGPSPYSMKHKASESDYLYHIYEDNVNQNHEAKCQALPLGAAIFGLGRAGSIHLSNVMGNQRVQLRYIVDDVTEKWDSLKKYWKLSSDVVFLTSKDSNKVYKDPKVDIVIVASPTYTHEEIITKSLDANKNVFSEKPIAEDMESTRRCYEKAKKVGKTLFSAFNRRFDPAYRTLKDRVRRGDVGHAQVLKVCARDSPLPTVDYLAHSGGVFHDCLVHDFDITTWVLGELPTKVQATASALIPEIKAIDDFDNIAFLLTFPSGTIVLGDNSRYSVYGYDQRLEVFGSKGMIKVENEKPCASTEFVYGQEGVKSNPIYYSFPSRYKLAYQNELEHFLDVVQKGIEPDVKGYQTLAVSRIATAAEESARTGKTVEIDWSNEDLPAIYS